jgi:hypothetical protein
MPVPGIADLPEHPETFRYRGDGIFVLSGWSVNLSREFKREMP